MKRKQTWHQFCFAGDTLLLINSFDEETSLQDDANGLASKLAQSAAGKIRFNLHERNFADLDPVSWTSDRMHDSRHVVFICTPVGKKKFDCCQQSPGTAVPVLNPYVVGLKLAQAWVRDSPFQSPKRITCVYFEPDHNECVPDCFKDRRRFGNVKKFCLRKDSDRFFKYVTNKSPTRKPDVKPTAPDCSREERVLLAGNAYLWLGRLSWHSRLCECHPIETVLGLNSFGWYFWTVIEGANVVALVFCVDLRANQILMSLSGLCNTCKAGIAVLTALSFLISLHNLC